MQKFGIAEAELFGQDIPRHLRPAKPGPIESIDPGIRARNQSVHVYRKEPHHWEPSSEMFFSLSKCHPAGPSSMCPRNATLAETLWGRKVWGAKKCRDPQIGR